MTGIYDFSATTLDGQETKLEPFRGRVLLIVNTASKCGFTPQYTGLEKLHKTYAPQGFEVLGFPATNSATRNPATPPKSRLSAPPNMT